MNKAFSFARLDFLTVKNYFTLKNLALMIAAPLFIVVSTGANAGSGAVFMIFSALYISYPFIICEKNGMDALYTSLSISRGSVVLGRYIFTLAFSVCAGLVGLAFTFAASTVMKQPVVVTEALLSILALFAVVSIVEAIQLPIYFKLGYEKAKILAYLPYMVFGLAAVGFTNMFPKGTEIGGQLREIIDWIAVNPAATASIAVAVWLTIMIISYRVSLSFYKNREF